MVGAKSLTHFQVRLVMVVSDAFVDFQRVGWFDAFGGHILFLSDLSLMVTPASWLIPELKFDLRNHSF